MSSMKKSFPSEKGHLSKNMQFLLSKYIASRIQYFSLKDLQIKIQLPLQKGAMDILSDETFSINAHIPALLFCKSFLLSGCICK